MCSNIAPAGLLGFSSPLDNLGFSLEILTIFLRGISKSAFGQSSVTKEFYSVHSPLAIKSADLTLRLKIKYFFFSS